MPKIKLSDMSYADRKEYQYYKRVLKQFYIYGPHHFKKTAEYEVAKIEEKYARGKSNAKN